MELPFHLISTDFDGTVFTEFEQPPVPHRLQNLLAWLQSHGVRWVINTGRDMSSLMESLGRAHLRVRPDFLVLVEREIFRHEDSRYTALEEWNQRCHRDHDSLFRRVRQDLPRIVEWINHHFDATVYDDAFSPFCLMAGSAEDADQILDYLANYCQTVPNLAIMRNDVYARLCHDAYTKGTALAEIGRRLGVEPARTLAAGDHFNDLPMLSTAHAHHLVAPVNAIDLVRGNVLRQGGYVSSLTAGEGILDGVSRLLRAAGFAESEWA